MKEKEAIKQLIEVCGQIMSTDATSVSLHNMYAAEHISVTAVYRACKDPMLYDILSSVNDNLPGMFAVAVRDYINYCLEVIMPTADIHSWNAQHSQAWFNYLIPIITKKLGRFYD